MKFRVASLAVSLMLTNLAFAANPKPMSVDRSGSFLIDNATSDTATSHDATSHKPTTDRGNTASTASIALGAQGNLSNFSPTCGKLPIRQRTSHLLSP